MYPKKKAFLGQPARSRIIYGIAAHQGDGSRVYIVGSKESNRYVIVRTRNFRIPVPRISEFSNQLAINTMYVKPITSGLANPKLPDCPR
jgi:hypothetical protein